MKPILVLALLLSAMVAKSVNIKSPDGDLCFQLNVENKSIQYQILSDGKPVLLTSELRMSIDEKELSKDVSLKSIQKYRVNETYPWLGAHSIATNHANGAVLEFENKALQKRFSIDVRVFNDGAAYRFIVPDNGKAQTPDESSTFIIPQGFTAWYHGLKGHYEDVHTKSLVSDIAEGVWAAAPVTIKRSDDKGYLMITEAALTNYPGMALQSNGKSGFVLQLAHKHPASYPYVLRYGDENAKRLSIPATIKGEIRTPWRVVAVCENLNALVNTDIVQNLAPAPDKTLFPQGVKTDWIKPGRAVWRYLDGGGEANLATMKDFSRMASEMGFENNILEGFWSRWPDADLKELVAYSKERHVGIWVWEHSKRLQSPMAQDSFFERCERLGFTGVKIDFLDHEAKEVIDLYDQLLKGAAKHHLMVNFHGSNKPTGMFRTWPNEMTREAVRGMETSKMVDRATHHTTLPFTRMVVGNADYTPLHFGERRKNTTWAHQLASTVIFNSDLLTFAANPQTMMDNPTRKMLERIPSVWDETIVLAPSEIGKIAVFARRKGDVWFLAGMNGVEAKSFSIPLKFLDKGVYKTDMVLDNKNDTASVTLGEKEFKRTDELKLDLTAGGGFVYRFSK
ncbi:MAG TPA: glycoside hydrolase family 97 catalytic domain-containing protein [Bacteroidales bacterium]|nr:glycoside hydrolase family 97 catalytic domain-containing protein [Bacteroidales bacterium]